MFLAAVAVIVLGLQHAQGQQLQPLARVAVVAPRVVAHRLQGRGACALPGLGGVDLQGVEAVIGQQVGRQCVQQARVGALPVAGRVTGQRQQRVAPLPAGGRGAEDVQPVADLRLFQLAQIGVDALQNGVVAHRLAGCGLGQVQLFQQVLLAHGLQDLPAQQHGAAGIDEQGVVVLVHQALQVLHGAVVLGPRQRRHQVIDDDRLAAPLGLRAFARVVDDERIQVRHGTQDGVGPAGARQRQALAGQPFEVAVLAHMHDGVDAEHIAQPEIEREVAVRRHQLGVVVAGVVLRTQAGRHAARSQCTRRLYTDEHLSQPQPGDHEAALAQRRVLLGRAPARVDGLGHAGRQRGQACAVVGQGIALPRGAQRPLARVVGNALLQPLHERIAVRGRIAERAQRIASVAQPLHDGHHRSRRIQPHAAADAAFTAGVVGQHQGQALVPRGQAAQAAPAPRQFSHEGNAVGLGLVGHHVRLRDRAAVRQPLEADGPRDDAAVHLGQNHLHGDIARAQALAVGPPVLAVAAAGDHLQHGRIARQRMALLQRREGRGVQHQLHLVISAQALQRGQAQRVLQGIERDRQRVDSTLYQRHRQRIESRCVAGHEVRSVEHQRHHRRTHAPHGTLQIVDAGHGVGVDVVDVVVGAGAAGACRQCLCRHEGPRHMNGCLRQAARWQRHGAPPQRMKRDRPHELQRIARPARPQVLPQHMADRRRQRAALHQLQVLLQIAREHRQPLPLAARQRPDLLKAVRPHRLGPQMVHDDHARVLQHLVHIQVERRGLPQRLQIGQAH